MEAFNEYFLNIIKNKYLLSEGRSRRKEYWMFFLFYFLVFLVLSIIASIIFQISSTLGTILYVIIGLANLGLILPTITLSIRRLHDIGVTGWLLLLNLIGLGFIPVIMAFIDSNPGDNKYGPNPKLL